MPKSRKKRDFLTFMSNDENMGGLINELTSNDLVNTGDQDLKFEDSVDISSMKFNDPMWSKLWYIVSNYFLIIYFKIERSKLKWRLEENFFLLVFVDFRITNKSCKTQCASKKHGKKAIQERVLWLQY
jgi:hypothetical protein